MAQPLEPSPHITELLDELAVIDRLLAATMGGEDERPIIHLEKRRELKARSLAQAPCLTAADVAALLSILCQRLREGLDPADTPLVVSYMLAEGARAGVLASVRA